MKKLLTPVEQKYILRLDKWHKNSEKLTFYIVIILLPLLIVLELAMSAYVKRFDPVQSRDRIWMAAMFGSWLFLWLVYSRDLKKLFAITRKLTGRIPESAKNKKISIFTRLTTRYPW